MEETNMRKQLDIFKPDFKFFYPDLYWQRKNNRSLMCDTSFTMGVNEVVKNSTIFAVSVIGATLSVTQPFIGATFATTSYILPIIWPSTGADSAQSFLCAAENLINEKLAFFVNEQAQSRFNGLKNTVDLFNTSMIHYIKNPNSTNYTYVISQFTATNTTFAVSMPLFQVRGYEVLLLPLFTQAANLYLLFLRDAIAFFKKYRSTLSNMQKISDLNTNRLKDLISEYTDYCVKIYHEGLQMMNAPKKQANLTNRLRYPWVNWKGSFFPQPDRNAHEGIESWNLMNDYRRTYTLTVLDFLPLWDTYSQPYFSFPGVRLSLTRELYTSARGKSTFHPQTPHMRTRKEIEKAIVRPPHLVTWLEDATINLRNYKQYPLSGVDTLHYLSGYLNKVQYNTIGFPGSMSCSIYDYPIFKNEMVLNAEGYVGNIKFFNQANELINQCGDPSANNFIFIHSIPDSKEVESSFSSEFLNTLSDIRGGIPYQNEFYNNDSNGHLDYISLGWLHPSLDRFNTLLVDKVVQISAVRGNALLGEASVIKGPGSTGGDLIKLGEKGGIKIPITLPNNVQQYALRIRCAHKYEKGLLQIETDFRDTIMYIPYNPNFDESLHYNSFQLIDASKDFIIIPENKYLTLSLYNLGTEIILDKIELIPYLS